MKSFPRSNRIQIRKKPKKKKKEEKKKRIIGHRATQPLYKGLVCNFTRPLSISELLIPSPLLTLPPFAATNAAAESIFLRLGLGFPLIPNAILRRVPIRQTEDHDGRKLLAIRVDSRSRRADLAAHAVQATLRATGSISICLNAQDLLACRRNTELLTLIFVVISFWLFVAAN